MILTNILIRFSMQKTLLNNFIIDVLESHHTTCLYGI
ncbi:hypothetical protein HEBU111660_08365 [Helicobacter burdigaliensis]